MTTKSLIVKRQELYDIVEIVSDASNSYQFTSLKKFHTGGYKKIVNRTYFADKSSIFIAITLSNDNMPIEGIFDINTYKQSRNKVNGTYRIEYFAIGSLNGEPCTMVFLSLISRKGVRTEINNIKLTGVDIPKTLEDLEKLLARFEEIICSLSDRSYTSELFKISTIYSQIELLEEEKKSLNYDEQAIIDGIIASLASSPQTALGIK